MEALLQNESRVDPVVALRGASGKVRSMDRCLVNGPCTPQQGRNIHLGGRARMARLHAGLGGRGRQPVVAVIARPGLSDITFRWAGSRRMPAHRLAEPGALCRMAGLAQPNWQTRSAIT